MLFWCVYWGVGLGGWEGEGTWAVRVTGFGFPSKLRIPGISRPYFVQSVLWGQNLVHSYLKVLTWLWNASKL